MTDKQKELLDEMTKVSQECGLFEKDINVPSKQIIEKIKDLKQTYQAIKEKSSVFTSEFTLASGAITALNQVLEILKSSNSRELENEVSDER